MRTEITKLHNRLATTFIYVTHDQIEAMTMGTRIVVMKDGFMQQVDTPLNLYDYPANIFVGGFIGTPQMNFIDGVLTGTKDEVYLEFGPDKIKLPKSKVDLIVGLEDYLNTDKPITLGIRPEDIHDEKEWVEWEGAQNIVVDVDVIEALGSETILYCKTKKDQVEEGGSFLDAVADLVAKVDARSSTKANAEATIALDVMHCHIFDKETEVTILAKDEAQKAELYDLQQKAIAQKEAREQMLILKAQQEAKKKRKKSK
jgi:multiple sugar transport system ATP-binding protein